MNSQTPPRKWGGGGGDSLGECHSGDEIHAANPTKPNAHLYTIRTIYRVFGVPLFRRTYTKIHSHAEQSSLYFGKNPLDFQIQCAPQELYFRLSGGYINEYVSKSPNIEQEIKALIRGLSLENQISVLRQIAREKVAYENGTWCCDKLTKAERTELTRIYTEFYPNIFKLAENLYTYDGYLFPTNFCEINAMWHKHGLNMLEPQTLTKMRQKDFIDVGGCIGDSAIIFEREFCDKNIYTFEPTRKSFSLLGQTLRLNDSKRIIPINMGLGAEPSELVIHYNEQNIGGSSAIFYNEVTQAEITQITTLDEFVAERGIEVGFIKVDIEGFEMEFLKGAKKTICEQKPAMLISIYHQPSDYFGIKPLIESWNLGYKFKIYKCVDGSITNDTVLFCEILE